MTRWYLAACLLLATVPAQAALRCGVATGYPPYQYQHEGQPAGFDVDVMNALVKRAGETVVWVQRDWDDLMGLLRVHQLDSVVGMEMTSERAMVFKFTRPYYQREAVMFLRIGDPEWNFRHARGQVITGDRHSPAEHLLGERLGLRDYRLTYTPTKEAAMQMLLEGKSRGAVMPREVGWFLARQFGPPGGVKVKEVSLGAPGALVAIAVPGGDEATRSRLDEALALLLAEGIVKQLYEQRFGVSQPGRSPVPSAPPAAESPAAAPAVPESAQ